MTTRRGFLAGLMAAGLAPRISWADAGSPAYVSAARLSDGSYALIGLSEQAEALFQISLPARGHAAATHPSQPYVVAFARRPGTFAMVINCISGLAEVQLDAPAGRHFCGHGAFSADGALLFTSENDFDAVRGMVGVWDVASGYRRIDEFATGGIGPHELRLMPDGETLVIANGGIETHPDSGRTKLNIPTMEPSLSYVSTAGRFLEKVTLPTAMHKNSIRHLTLRADGTVAFAMQWQGADLAPPLLALHRRGTDPRLLSAPPEQHRQMSGYAGSVAMTRDGTLVAITSPRGGMLQVFDVDRGYYIGAMARGDICGVGPAAHGFAATTGMGDVIEVNDVRPAWSRRLPVQWDNHLVAVRA
ncbi:hypothetical protein ATO10_08057 [Actibacterium atlanticum]|uniref:Twin-arginine translocation pathway signal n=1 Tax=Actibacterium atlanticum TaxID=1461693 RepID=A0A058ZLB2_9RHOB|nr:DUF1513 domain-containing protein [Actibacterium atlanticum]KCV82328.1 hypothetical protein ATO10_08057 [Actibacterium atlanticum]